MILIWRFGNCIKIAKLNYTIIDPFILQAWISLHTLLKSASLKSYQQCFLSKQPNIIIAYISAYTVVADTYIYVIVVTWAQGLRAYISGKARVPMLQVICDIALWRAEGSSSQKSLT